MTDRPIIFSAPMIQALLAGRKSETRRIIAGEVPAKPSIDDFSPKNVVRHPAPYLDAYCGGPRTVANPRGMTDRWCWWTRDDRCGQTFKVPYVPGDRLWVREAHQIANSSNGPCVLMRATSSRWSPEWTGPDEGAGPSYDYDRCPGDYSRWAADVEGADGPWRPSIHMPRWASRLTLPVVSVRVQRLLDITEEDAEAEGVCNFVEQGHRAGSFEGVSGAERSALVRDIYGSSREAFRALWEGLHGRGSWNANPWVVAVGVEVHCANIDALDSGRAAA